MKSNIIVTKLFLIAIFISSILFSPFALDFSLIARFISLSLFLLVIIYFIYQSKSYLSIKVDFVLFFYFAYCLVCCFSFFWAKNKSEAIFESCKIILSVLIFLLSYLVLKKQQEYFMEKLLKLSIIIFILALSVGFWQYIHIRKVNKETIYLITGLNGHKNLYASFLFLNLFFLLIGSFKLTSQWRIASITSLFLNLCVLFFLGTKAVFVGLLISAVVFGVLYLYQLSNRKFYGNIYASLFFCLLVSNVFFLYVLQPTIQKGIHHTVEAPTTILKQKEVVRLEQERLVIWDKTYHTFNKNKLLGVGMGNWQIHFPDATLSGLWRAEDLNYTFQRPHNDFLWIMAETGLLGLNLFLLFLFSLLLLLAKAIKTISNNLPLKVELMLCSAFIIGFFAISFFDFPKERIEHLIWIHAILGIAYYHIKKNYPVAFFITLPVTKVVYYALLGVVICITAIGILRYRGEFYVRKMFDYKNRNQSIKLLKAGNNALSFAYTIDPTSMPIHWYIGNAQAQLGNYEQAKNDFIKAYHYNPQNRNVLNDLASSYAKNNEYELAIKYYTEATRISPRFDEPKLNLVALYIDKKEYDMAAKCLNTLFHDSERRSNYQKIIDAFSVMQH
jgi:O-antigen ligase